MARPSSPVPSIAFDEKKLEAGSTEHREHVAPREFVAADETCFESYSEEETRAMEKRFVRKIDFRVLPVLVLLFILNILDRSNIANAKVSGMTKDLHLTGLDYNNLVVFAFLGYCTMQIGVGFFFAKISPALALGVCAFAWGIVSMSCGFAHSYASMAVLRVLVGVCEAPFFPTAVLILSSFYTRKEVPQRIAIIYSGNSISNGFGGLLASGLVTGMEGLGGLAGWRWLFVIEGLMTVVAAVLCYWALPGLPSKTPWLSEEERRFAVWRSAVDAMGDRDEETDVSKWQAVKLVLKDWKILLLILQQVFIACVQSFTYFFPSIVASLGYGTTQTLLLTAPPYIFAFVCSLAVAFSSSYFQEVALHISIPMALTCVGNVLAITLPTSNVAGRYSAMFLMCLGSYAAYNLSFAWISSSVPRPRAKRSGALFLVNAMGNASHFFTPYMFPSSDGPRYVPGGISLAVFSILVCCTATTIKFTLRWQNKKMDQLDAQGKEYTGAIEGVPKGYRFTC